MSKFRFLNEDEIEHMPPEPGEDEILYLEIAFQLKRVADALEARKEAS